MVKLPAKVMQDYRHHLSPEKEQEVQAKIDHIAQYGRIQCAQALAIAKSLSVKPETVGMIADQMGIRVAQCQIGCF